MKLEDLAERIGAKVLVAGSSGGWIAHVYAGDRISDLLNHAGDGTLLVSNLPGIQLVRLAELMDLPGLCLVGGTSPDDGVVAAAQAHGTGLVVSPVGMFETCGRIYECLHPERSVT
jgi:hypothetical protein